MDAKNNIAKADFCRLALGTFLDRIARRADINERRITADTDYNIRLLISQIIVVTLLHTIAPIKYQHQRTNPRRLLLVSPPHSLYQIVSGNLSDVG